MDWQEHIVFDPEICFGKPTVRRGERPAAGRSKSEFHVSLLS